MKGWQMYSKIQAMKEQGFSIRQVSPDNPHKPSNDKEVLGDDPGGICGEL